MNVFLLIFLCELLPRTRYSLQVQLLQKTSLFPCFVFCNVIYSMCRRSVFAVFLGVVLLFQCYVAPPVFRCFAAFRLFLCSVISRTSSSSSSSIFLFFGIKYMYIILYNRSKNDKSKLNCFKKQHAVQL